MASQNFLVANGDHAPYFSNLTLYSDVGTASLVGGF
jgi:hypothetical protein